MKIVFIEWGLSLKNKINDMREKLHKEIEFKGIKHKDVIKISEILNQLIIQYYEKEQIELK